MSCSNWVLQFYLKTKKHKKKKRKKKLTFSMKFILNLLPSSRFSVLSSLWNTFIIIMLILLYNKCPLFSTIKSILIVSNYTTTVLKTTPTIPTPPQEKLLFLVDIFKHILIITCKTLRHFSRIELKNIMNFIM